MEGDLLNSTLSKTQEQVCVPAAQIKPHAWSQPPDLYLPGDKRPALRPYSAHSASSQPFCQSASNFVAQFQRQEHLPFSWHQSLSCIHFQWWKPARFLWFWLPSLSPHRQGTCLDSFLWGRRHYGVSTACLSDLTACACPPGAISQLQSKWCNLSEPQFSYQKNEDMLMPQSCCTDYMDTCTWSMVLGKW